jgi:G3E family GTPase
LYSDDASGPSVGFGAARLTPPRGRRTFRSERPDEERRMSFANEWSQAKKDFEAQTGQKKPAPVAQTLFGIERKSTDIASALRAIDAALAKKSRNDLVEAYKTYAIAQNEYVTFTRTARKGLGDEDRPFLDVLVSSLNKISVKVGAEIEKLRESKGGVKIPADTFLADFKADRTLFEKGVKSTAAEKKWGLLKRSEPMLKALESYSTHSAKSDYAKAAADLADFKSEADKFAVHSDTAIEMEAKVTASADYVKRTKEFQKFVANLWPSRIKRQKEFLDAAVKG